MSDKENIYDLDELKRQIAAEVCAQFKNILPSIQSGSAICYNDTYIESGDSNLSGRTEGGENMAAKYRQRVKIGSDESGMPIYKWVSGNTQDELNQHIANALNSAVQQKAREDCPVWQDYAERWFNAFKVPTLKPKTIQAQRGLLSKHVKPAFENKRLDEITTFDAMEVLNLKKDYKQSYVRDIQAMMKQILASAVEDGFIQRNPMDSKRVKNPSKNKATERKALSQSEQADIIRQIPMLSNISDRRFMAMLMFTSLRPSEIFGLRWENVDTKNNLLLVDSAITFAGGKGVLGDTKTEGSVRYFPIEPRLMEFLQPIQDEGFVICRFGRGHDGEHYTEQAMKRAWERIKKQINVHGMTPYVGRHTFATNMSKAGVSMKTAMTLMGHTDERMLMRHYVHTDIDDIKEASRKLAGFIGANNSTHIG